MENTQPEPLIGETATRCMGVVFAALLLAPLVVWLTGFEIVEPVGENRKSAEQPTLQQLAASPAKAVNQFRNYYNDNFGLRPLFLRTNAVVNIELLRQSSSDSVILGNNRWLYYRSPEPPFNWEPVAYYNNVNPIEPERLQEWENRLRVRRTWLAKRGIEFYLVIAPAKPRVYPEFFPDEIKPDEPTPLDAFVEHIKETTDVEVIDLRQAMQQAKDEVSAPIYFQWDTHWNAYGAHAAHTEIMQRLRLKFPKAKPFPIESFKRSVVTSGNYDLSRIAAIDGWFSKTEPTLSPLPEPRAVGRDAKWPGAKTIDRDTSCDDALLGRAVVFHDSFGLALRPFFARTWQHVGFAHQLNFDGRIIEYESPEVVIQIIVERQIISDEVPDDVWE